MAKNTYLAVLAAVFLLSLCLPWAWTLGGLLVALIAFKDPAALRKIGGLGFWAFPTLFVLLSPFMAGEPDRAVLTLPYSMPQLRINMSFLMHAYCFTVLMSYFGRNYTLAETAGLGEKLGLKKTGLKTAIALCSAKKLRRMIIETARTYARTRPAKTDKAKDLHILLGAIIRNTALTAEEISVLFYIRKIEL
ncbi:MAG: hypothetical protein WCS77_01180 [Elusimicrobiaceae bacterium]|jgi:hypothetical protein